MRFGCDAHVILTADMNKALFQILCLVLMMTSGLAFTLAISPATTGAAQAEVGAAATPAARVALPAPASGGHQQLTPTPTPEAVSHPGSTDGIMVMSIAIVVIILVPILLQRSMWKK